MSTDSPLPHCTCLICSDLLWVSIGYFIFQWICDKIFRKEIWQFWFSPYAKAPILSNFMFLAIRLISISKRHHLITQFKWQIPYQFNQWKFEFGVDLKKGQEWRLKEYNLEEELNEKVENFKTLAVVVKLGNYWEFNLSFTCIKNLSLFCLINSNSSSFFSYSLTLSINVLS